MVHFPSRHVINGSVHHPSSVAVSYPASIGVCYEIITLPETNIAPENGWLED